MSTQITIRAFKISITRFFLASLIMSRAAWGLDCTAPHWVAAWQSAPSGAAPIVFRSNNFPMGSHQSFREVFSPLGHGSMLRLKFSNRFSKVPLVIDKVTLARQSVDAELDPAILKQVFFNGKPGLTIQPGKETLSDPVSFNFVSIDRLTVSIAVGKVSLGFIPTEHNYAREYSYATLPGAGDHSADTHGKAYVFKTTRRHILVGMETLAPADYSAIVTLGDSITDGSASTQEKPEINVRYPDFLKRRIDASGLPMFVSNAGISGNKVATLPITTFLGRPALERYPTDVLQQAGVRDVILLEGINDIGANLIKTVLPLYTYKKIINGYTTLIKEFQKQGIKVTQGTLTPAGKSKNIFYSGSAARSLRQQVNWWIRNHSPADTIVDFDAAVRDPRNVEFIRADYDLGDGIHLSEKGYMRLAESIDLSRFQGSACRQR
jgi:lysophospholipase L1-like esterase